MQLLLMQHQEEWLRRVNERLRAQRKDLASIRTWLRVPYCIGAHMDREGCAFAYLSPDVDNAGQRAWLQFPQIKWHDGGLMAIACALMELAVRVVIYPTLLSAHSTAV